MKVVGLLSGKGGVGKTTCAVNIAAGLNYFGKRVVVVDGNLTTPNVGLHLGVPVSPFSLHHVLKDECSIHESVQKHPSGFSFIPGSLSITDLEGMKLSKMKKIRELDTDYVILDGGAGLGGEAIKVMEQSDELFIVTNAELPAITDALKTVKLASEMGKDVRGIIVTRVKQDDLDISVANIESLLEKPVVAVVDEDDSLREALSLKDVVVHTHPHSSAARSYLKFTANMCGAVLAPIPAKKPWFTRIFEIYFG
jgi:septum site-determining protein MinD